MENMKKYDKLQNKGFTVEQFVKTGLVVQEKMDGSNASFTINDGKLECFSRRQVLDAHKNTLNGFYNWVHDYVDARCRSTYLENVLEKYIIFGEWLVKHKVQYNEEAYKKFYVFDIYDKETDEYLDWDSTTEIIVNLGLNYVQTLYINNRLSMLNQKELELIDKQIRSYVGQSELVKDNQQGEGIVIKPYARRKSEDYTYKIVTDTFKEFSKRKMNNEKKSNDSVADYAITTARMEKQIFRAIEENRLAHDDLKLESFGKVIKEVGQNFVDDIFEEETKNMLNIIEKQIKKKMPIILREILEKDQPLG